MEMLNDRQIAEFQTGNDKIIVSGWNPENAKDVFLDLIIESVVQENGNTGSYTLHPGESVFVKTSESFNIPKNMVAFIHERTSAVRLGIGISGVSPLKPGFRGACFIRVSNLSEKEISLNKGFGIAQINFLKLDSEPSQPYDSQQTNHFQDETDFRGLAGYNTEYSHYVTDVKKKKDELEKLQGHIYANVISILGVFSAIIAILVTNVQAFSADKSLCQILSIDVAIIISVFIMMLSIRFLLKNKN